MREPFLYYFHRTQRKRYLGYFRSCYLIVCPAVSCYNVLSAVCRIRNEHFVQCSQSLLYQYMKNVYSLKIGFSTRPPVCFFSQVELSVGMLVSNNDTQGRQLTLKAMSNVDSEANEVFLKYSWFPQNETDWSDNAVYREILLLHVLLHLVLRSWCPNKNINKAGEWNRSYYSARGCSSLIDQHTAFRSEHVSVKNLDFIMIQGANTEDIT